MRGRWPGLVALGVPAIHQRSRYLTKAGFPDLDRSAPQLAQYAPCTILKAGIHMWERVCDQPHRHTGQLPGTGDSEQESCLTSWRRSLFSQPRSDPRTNIRRYLARFTSLVCWSWYWLAIARGGNSMRVLNSVTIYSSVQDSPVLGWHRSQASPMSSLLFEGPRCHMLWSRPPEPCP